ncbi:threonine--tRNA ligase [Salix suchowensis]|nr:threonine--tRNA ligase [Salix suchowensis]
MVVSSRSLILEVTKDATPFGIQVLTFSARHLKRSMVTSFALDPETRGEGFYYDAYYGELGLNDNHLKQIDAAVLKVVANFLFDLLILGPCIVQWCTHWTSTCSKISAG